MNNYYWKVNYPADSQENQETSPDIHVVCNLKKKQTERIIEHKKIIYCYPNNSYSIIEANIMSWEPKNDKIDLNTDQFFQDFLLKLSRGGISAIYHHINQ